MKGVFVIAVISGVVSAALLGWYLAFQFGPKIQLLKFEISPSPTKIKLGTDQKILLAVFGTGLLLASLLDFFLGFLVMAIAFVFWWIRTKGPSWRNQWSVRKRQEKMMSVFPQALGMAIQALKAGQTIPQVLEYLSNESPSPLRDELRGVSSEMNLGASAEQALSKMADRFPDFSEFHQFLESYRISRQTGANLTHLLQVLVDGLEEKNRLLRKMDSMTAQARLSGLMIGALPFLMGAVFFVMDPNLLLPLFTQKMGWALLTLAAVLETIGFAWIRQLLRLEV